ncbi:MAG: hypothetical protein ACXV2F_06620 [Halobacteriota archaeon]
MKLKKFNTLVAVREMYQHFKRIPPRKGFSGIRAEHMIVALATSITSILETRELESKHLKNRR